MRICYIGGSAFARLSDGLLIFVTRPVQDGYKIGDPVPDGWWRSELFEIEEFIKAQPTAIQEGYYVGLENKDATNPYIVASHHHARWHEGYQIGCAHRNSFDED